MANKYEGKTRAELDALKQGISDQRDKLKEEARLINECIAWVDTEAKYQALPDAEKKRLTQIIQAQAIDSQERVGTPGA